MRKFYFAIFADTQWAKHCQNISAMMSKALTWSIIRMPISIEMIYLFFSLYYPMHM